MRRVVIDRPGSYNRLRIVEEQDPVPGEDQILIAVEAVGVNYADCVIRMGLYESANRLHGFPITPGFEVAGRVAAVGSAVEGFAIGQSVLGVTLFGGYTSHIALDSDRVFALPDGLGALQAVTLPVAYLTAWFALVELARCRRGDAVLVHSAAGGVGTALCQLGRMTGCHVVGVVGASHKVDAATQAGADVVIDKSTQALWPEAERAAPDGYQAIFDANGVSTLQQSYEHVAPMGKLVIYGFHSMLPRKGGRPNWIRLAWDYLRTPRFNPLKLTVDNRSVMACNLSFLGAHAELLRRGMLDILAWIAAGEIRSLPVKSYPLDEVAQAHRDIESAQTVGKLVLLP